MLQKASVHQHTKISAPDTIQHSKNGGWATTLSRGLQFDDSPLQRDCDGMGAVVCAKFGEYVLDVALDCLLGNRKLIGDKLVCISGANQPDDIDFSCRQGAINRVVSELGSDLRGNALLPGMDSPNRLEKLLSQEALQ